MAKSIADQKNQLRGQIRQRLEEIPFFELIEKSGALRERFLKDLIRPHLKYVSQKAILGFYPFDTEPQINLEEEGAREPYLVAYVRIEDWPQRKMAGHYARRDQPGQWEEIEPAKGVRIFQPVATQALCLPDEMAMVMVPSLAFSPEGKRLGRGAGFYDRFLKSMPGVLRVGIAVHEQISPVIPYDLWDESVDVVITDRETFTTNHFSEWQSHGKVLSRGIQN